ncbi:unnamed protein product, partial [Ectocarpus sp. 12 AP-2014]
MNDITIDATTGDVAVKTMIRYIMPDLDENGILKSVPRVLESYDGPKISTRLINGRSMSVATLGLCYDILEKMRGPRWRTWREESGQSFKQALGERVERARSSVQTDRPPRQQVEVGCNEQVERFLVMQKALRSVHIHGSVRIDEYSGKAAIIDTIRVMCPEASTENAAHMLTRTLERNNRVISIGSRIAKIKINGRGNITPVTDFKTLIEIVWMLPSAISRRLRWKSAETMYRVMGGDLKLLRDIEQNNMAWRSIDGEVIQRALIEPIEYYEEVISSRVKERSVRDALSLLVGGKTEQETPVGFIDVLSDTEVIEVKHYTLWKHGLGQMLSYQLHHPHLAKRLHLFAQVGDKDTDKYLEKAKSACDPFAVKVTFE